MTTTRKRRGKRTWSQALGTLAAALVAVAVATGATACTRSSQKDARGDEELALAIGHALATSCPTRDDPADEDARDRCADRLTDLAVLRESMREPFLWGGQATPGDYSLADRTTKLNPRVWRRLYLSTFMFGDAPEVERRGDLTILHVPTRFRHALPTGAFPYPFWHLPKKWDSYSYSTAIHVLIQDGAVVGALRAASQDRARPTTARSWSGSWRWEEDGSTEPRASLYGYLLSKGNPHEARLGDAFRALEAAMRPHQCQACHAPDNRGGSRQLELFEYPSQALAGRHDIVAQLDDDLMPPDNDLGIAPGISDPAERARLLEVARAFESAGDDALDWEDRARPVVP